MKLIILIYLISFFRKKRRAVLSCGMMRRARDLMLLWYVSFFLAQQYHKYPISCILNDFSRVPSSPLFFLLSYKCRMI